MTFAQQLHEMAVQIRRCAAVSQDGLEKMRLIALADTVHAESRMQFQAMAARAERLAVRTA